MKLLTGLVIVALSAVCATTDNVEDKRFLMQACHRSDMCNAGGTCLNNRCHCVDGWTGDLCMINDWTVEGKAYIAAHIDTIQKALGGSGGIPGEHGQQGNSGDSGSSSSSWSSWSNCIDTSCHAGSSSSGSSVSSSKLSTCNLHCNQNGRCAFMSDGSQACICSGYHSGQHCEYRQQDNCGGHCYSHGKCVYHHHSGYSDCLCEQGYSSTHCDRHETNTNNHVDHCNNHCVNGDCSGTYSNSHNTWVYSCKCHGGWYGDMCDSSVVDYVQCGTHMTCYHGQCHTWTTNNNNHNHHYHRCSCHHGWQGQQCDQAIPPTTLNPVTHRPYIEPSTTKNPTTHAPVTTKQPTTVAPTTPTPTTTTASTTQSTTPTPTTTIASTTPTTTSIPVVTATSPPHTVPTSGAPIHYFQCTKLSTLSDLATRNVSSNQMASTCSSGSHHSPEAFVLNHCTISMPSKWTQGENVMSSCSKIPAYTPIATFVNGVYSPTGGLSAIFIECSGTGIKVAVQQCDQAPVVTHIDGGIYVNDPKMYYTIM